MPPAELLRQAGVLRIATTKRMKTAPTQLLLLAGVLVFIGKPGASAEQPLLPADSVHLYAEVSAVDGTPYDGPIHLYIQQALSSGADSGGPFRATCNSGVLSMTINPRVLDHGSTGVAYFWVPNAKGITGANSDFYVDATAGTRAVCPFRLPAPGGSVAMGDLQLATPPLFGRILAASTQGSHPMAELQIAREEFRFGSVGELYESHSVNVGPPTSVYSWRSTERAEFRIEAPDGWTSADSYLNRGETVGTTLHPQGAIVADFDPAQYADVHSVLVFNAALYTPFKPPTEPPHWVRSAAYIHVQEGRSGAIRNRDHTRRHFEDLPAGSYVLELWTDSNLQNPIPAPAYTTRVTVNGGQSTVVSLL